jgi:hypothetical protein
LIGQVGSVGEQRFAMLTDIVRADLQDPGEKQFITMLLDRVARLQSQPVELGLLCRCDAEQ